MSKVAIIAIVVFVAELGDKSQLMALALAAKHRTRDVFLGIFLAIIVSFGVAVILGALIGEALDAHRAPIAITAGILFLAFAAWTLKGDADSDDGDMSPLSGKLGPWSVISGSFLVFTVAEFGDKAQLAVITLAVHEGFWPVYAGSIIGMTGAVGLAILIGGIAGPRLPERLIRRVGALLFVMIGIAMIASGVGA